MKTRRPRLLIVDDEADMLRLLSRSVGQDLDCEIETAGNGAEALVLFEEQAFDLALLDIRMPGGMDAPAPPSFVHTRVRSPTNRGQHRHRRHHRQRRRHSL